MLPSQVAPRKRQKAEGRRQKAEGRRQKAEGRRQKAEGRRQKAEGRSIKINTSSFTLHPTLREAYERTADALCRETRPPHCLVYTLHPSSLLL
ncbi:hypothetical protein [Fischerella sp. JS2]|uniref:hypothetical protein n=1 Tax=Fischerella sp. JS2 TaxID=2597771 RepID=UPI0028E5E85D|nr:hypothetical protein [Fischerella sp. JS2]